MAWLNLSYVQSELGDNKKAAACARRAIALEAKSPDKDSKYAPLSAYPARLYLTLYIVAGGESDGRTYSKSEAQAVYDEGLKMLKRSQYWTFGNRCTQVVRGPRNKPAGVGCVLFCQECLLEGPMKKWKKIKGDLVPCDFQYETHDDDDKEYPVAKQLYEATIAPQCVEPATVIQ